MPSQLPLLVALRGDESYARALDRLTRAVNATGRTPIENRHKLAEYALAVLALQHGVKLPARAKPVGYNQYGKPKAAKP